MDFVARIRLLVDVPFQADGATDEERIQAAIHAEQRLAGRLEGVGAAHGEVVSVLVEEVREAT